MIELPAAAANEGHTYSTAALDCKMSQSLLLHVQLPLSTLSRQGCSHMLLNLYRLISYVPKKMFKSVW